MSKTEKVINVTYITGGLVLLTTVVMMMSSCGTSQLTQEQVKINYELDKMWIDYKYKSDSLINEFYSTGKVKNKQP